ncbi:MAG: dTDP-4-dehydrorhamnose 3,5-epimerase [Gammaproteobacteria bacterium]|nr:dTDP-4-dehydrorhamnose 3,5-epimerase [Gammaproteobacteria bacterium]MCW5582802.1 dTDP-4-dehydrorhamnose 3,5-epimerase [Gammaproteobacteria bacterium]
MKVIEGPLSGLLIIEPSTFTDNRGYFYEAFQENRYQEYGIPHFVQDNVSRSKRHVLRGLHYQLPHAQGKLVFVTRGSVWDVVVDIRTQSSTFGQWFGIHLNEENHAQLYVPPGFAHGFCVLSDEVDFYYKCTGYYFPGTEHGIAWNDIDLNIPWPIDHPILSPKDSTYPLLRELTHEKLFT